MDEYVSAVDEGKPWEAEQDLARRLERTNKLLRLWLEPDSVGFAWEERKAELWGSGSFRELDLALRKLREHAPRRFSLWWRVIVLDEPIVLSQAMRGHLEDTSDQLAALMPRPIKVPPWLRPDRHAQIRKSSLWRGRTNGHADQRSERDKQIAHQAALGWSAKKIADYHGLDKRRVNQILAKAREEVAA